MRGSKIFLLLVIAVIVVLTGWVYLTGMSAERTVLNRSYYQELIDETGLASTIHTELQEILPKMISEEVVAELDHGLVENLSELEKVAVRNLAALITSALADTFDEEWIKDQLLIVIADFIFVAKGEQDELTALIDISEGRQDLREKMIASFENLPPPVKERLGLPEREVELFVDKVMAEMDLPDRIYVVRLIEEEDEDLLADIEQSLSTIQSFRGIYLYLLPIIFALSLICSILLAGFPGGLKWFGAAVAFFSATFMLEIRLFLELFGQMLLPWVEEEIPLLGPEMLQQMASHWAETAMIIPAISGFLGAILVLGGFLYGRITR